MSMATEALEELGFYSNTELDRLTSLSPVTRWRLVRDGKFPSPETLSPGRVGTRKALVHQWIADPLGWATTEKTVDPDTAGTAARAQTRKVRGRARSDPST
jgi:predicted DNA-binding transcriptional regulator AlpA